MANRLRVAEIHSILTLYERGWSCRRIARELGVHRETVGNYVRRGWDPPGPDLATARPAPTGDLEGVGAKPAKAPTSSGVQPASKPAKAPTGSFEAVGAEPATPGSALTEMDASRSASIAGGAPPGRLDGHAAAAGMPPRSMSACRAHHAAIVAGVELGLSATRIWQDLREQHPADLADNADAATTIPSYYSVRRYARALRRVCEPPMRRMECEPGVEAQVDFGIGAPIIDQHGRKRRTHVLRVVLSHSRKGYSEVVYRQTTEEFIRCIENAFHHFGGTPGTLVLDNLRAAVSRAD